MPTAKNELAPQTSSLPGEWSAGALLTTRHYLTRMREGKGQWQASARRPAENATALL